MLPEGYMWEDSVKKFKEDNVKYDFPIESECSIIINVYVHKFHTNISLYTEYVINAFIEFRVIDTHTLIRSVTCNTHKLSKKETDKMEVTIYIDE